MTWDFWSLESNTYPKAFKVLVYRKMNEEIGFVDDGLSFYAIICNGGRGKSLSLRCFKCEY